MKFKNRQNSTNFQFWNRCLWQLGGELCKVCRVDDDANRVSRRATRVTCSVFFFPPTANLVSGRWSRSQLEAPIGRQSFRPKLAETSRASPEAAPRRGASGNEQRGRSGNTRLLLKYDEVDGEMNGSRKKVIYYCSVLLTRYEDKCATTAFVFCWLCGCASRWFPSNVSHKSDCLLEIFWL